MRREELEHIIRVAARLTGQDVVVIGSQAVLATDPDPPAALVVSVEADVYPIDEPERAIEIDGAIGEYSTFHETFHYYAHGVGPDTPRAPAGWQGRLVPVRNENTDEKTGWCMEIHDLVLSKCAAGREKDWEYAAEAITAGLVRVELLFQRIDDLPLPDDEREHIKTTLSELLRKLKPAGRK